ncbi:MAG: ATP synthase F1 subunit delta, partial [Duncaniella sp.]|nr:ATP synthase F1 subunit delta [Duncaniella sp.]
AQTLAEAFKAEPGLSKAMSNPFVSAADKTKLLETAAGPEAKGDAVWKRFVDLLVENGRIDAVRDIALAYTKLYRRRHNIRLVTVTSAAPLDAAEEQRLKALIQKHLGEATMEYNKAVDPDLIGGFTVSIDNEKLDASIAAELKQMRQTLLNKCHHHPIPQKIHFTPNLPTND